MKLNFRAVDLIRIVCFPRFQIFPGNVWYTCARHTALSWVLLKKNYRFLLLASSFCQFFANNINKKHLNECIIEIGRFKWDHTAASVQLESPDSVLFLAYQRTQTRHHALNTQIGKSKGLESLQSTERWFSIWPPHSLRAIMQNTTIT